MSRVDEREPTLPHEYFARAVRRWPDRIAVEVPPGSGRPKRTRTTYAQLDDWSTAIALRLRTPSGYLVHVEGWAEFQVWKAVSLAAGLYAVRDNTSDGTVDDEGYDTSIDDEGFQFVATSTLTRSLELSLWYTRSRAYAYNTYSVSLGVDIAGMFRESGTSSPDRRRIRR